jgi:radical SAM superfamily enzyme YgiQ (UPF0313 family)
MKTLFVGINSKYIHTALGIRSLAAYCRKQGREVRILEESINTPILQTLIKIEEQKPQVLGFSVHIWNKAYVYQLLGLVRQVLPQAVLIVGGPEVMFAPEKVRQEAPAVNYVVCGEGELCVNELLAQLETQPDTAASFAILGRTPQGEPAVLSDLSCLEFPYPDLEQVVREHKICYYECTRGCPFHCAYCLSGISHSVRRRPRELVLADLQRFLDAGAPLVKFVDRTYNLDEDYYLPILEYLARAETQATFHLEIKADLLSSRALKFFREAPPGRFQLEIGVQTTNPRTLAAIGRTNDWQQLAANVRVLLAQKNMHLHLDLIAGLPYEDLDSFARSFNEVYALQPQMLQLGFLKVLPGTVMAGKTNQYGMVYMPDPPYEILATKYLGTQELVLLKILSDVFDLTYNSGLFPQTLKFLVQQEAQGAFAFYQKLTSWWRAEGLFGSGHSTAHTTELLYRFAQSAYPGQVEALREILRYDVLVNQKGWQPEWLAWHSAKNYEQSSAFWREEQKVQQYVPDYTFKNWRLLKKKYALEEFDLDPLTFSLQKCWILVDYVHFKALKINPFSS